MVRGKICALKLFMKNLGAYKSLTDWNCQPQSVRFEVFVCPNSLYYGSLGYLNFISYPQSPFADLE